MKVYVVTLDTDYEDEDIAAIFEKVEDAKDWIESVHQNPATDFNGFDCYSIHERIVGADPVRNVPPIARFQPNFSIPYKVRQGKPWKWYF